MKSNRGQEVFYIKKKDLTKIRNYFFRKEKFVILALINVGINVALRISDLGNLKFEDITKEWKVKIKEKKTGKYKYIKLNAICKNNINQLKVIYNDRGILPTGYIFKSLNREYLKKGIDKSLNTSSVSKYFVKARIDLKIPYAIGTHSLRKTWGYNVYRRTKDIAPIMKVLNHSSASQTLKYIGIDQEEIDSIYDKFNF
ncbi:site-specific integrase [Fusobacterium ulcerans]|uniref:Tyr recombinase domain-containing protein n=1 Tax=Fusobacterium ulcerans 12-1B TaxID=457404 RepID=H1PYL4_9FUSO|nr:site-specific integrase [Fusobacterium ulcerans]EHO77203.1 hypothetical protein HMPREF0402_03507 [Fusobacterium ulcerans 12-1B]